MASNANGTNLKGSNGEFSNGGSTVRCNICGTLFPMEYKKCPKCKTLK